MPRNRRREYGAQADRIELLGRPVNNSCEFCRRKGLQCIIIPMDPKNRKCSACTRRGEKCENRFHSDNEWRKLEESKNELSAQLRVARAMFADYSRKLTESLARIERLKKHENFLNDRGVRMLNHDTAVSERLDEESPPSAEDLREIGRLADEHDAAQLAATLEGPSLTQAMNSPSFWENLDFSACGIVSPSGGNHPDAR